MRSESKNLKNLVIFNEKTKKEGNYKSHILTVIYISHSFIVIFNLAVCFS